MIQAGTFQRTLWAGMLSRGIRGGTYTPESGSAFNPAQRIAEAVAGAAATQILATLPLGIWTLGGTGGPPASALQATANPSQLGVQSAQSAGWATEHAVKAFEAVAEATVTELSRTVASVEPALLAATIAATVPGAHFYTLTLPTINTAALTAAMLPAVAASLPDSTPTAARQTYVQLCSEVVATVLSSVVCSTTVTGSNPTGGTPPPTLEAVYA